VDVSGIEPEVLELTPVDWTSHPAEAEDLLTREYTLICDLLSECWRNILKEYQSIH
jgi:hypothetical protein